MVTLHAASPGRPWHHMLCTGPDTLTTPKRIPNANSSLPDASCDNLWTAARARTVSWVHEVLLPTSAAGGVPASRRRRCQPPDYCLSTSPDCCSILCCAVRCGAVLCCAVLSVTGCSSRKVGHIYYYSRITGDLSLHAFVDRLPCCRLFLFDLARAAAVNPVQLVSLSSLPPGPCPSLSPRAWPEPPKQAMASKARSEDQHAYDNILSSASASRSFSPAAWATRHPRRRAPESDPSSAQIHESPQPFLDHTPPSLTCTSDEPALLPWDAVPPRADAPLFRCFLGARDRSRAFTNSTSSRPPLRHVTAPQAWPPRRDSLNAPTSGVR